MTLARPGPDREPPRATESHRTSPLPRCPQLPPTSSMPPGVYPRTVIYPLSPERGTCHHSFHGARPVTRCAIVMPRPFLRHRVIYLGSLCVCVSKKHRWSSPFGWSAVCDPKPIHETSPRLLLASGHLPLPLPAHGLCPFSRRSPRRTHTHSSTHWPCVDSWYCTVTD